MSKFTVRADNAVHDTIDGEVLAIRSDTGTYYSMTGPAATCWVALGTCQSIDAVCAAVAAHHDEAPANVAPQIQAFATALVAEALLAEAPTTAPEQAFALPTETQATPWAAPEFEKYTDMQDLLLFDPIHEVKPSGWPNTTDAAK
ncbi:MAG: PqqD family peptide modification chaperone [Ilumatobacter sp.]